MRLQWFSWTVTDLLMNPEQAIPILGKVVARMRDEHTSPGDALHVTNSSWHQLSDGAKEGLVAAYAGGKDAFGPGGEPWYPWGSDKGNSRYYGVELGFRRWKGVPPMQWR